ncbi:hypothetical protein J2T20_004528 [Paenibacillus wynnii]|nr:hypothetical protein [Paenibacillus wynnii]
METHVGRRFTLFVGDTLYFAEGLVCNPDSATCKA